MPPHFERNSNYATIEFTRHLSIKPPSDTLHLFKKHYGHHITSNDSWGIMPNITSNDFTGITPNTTSNNCRGTIDCRCIKPNIISNGCWDIILNITSNNCGGTIPYIISNDCCRSIFIILKTDTV